MNERTQVMEEQEVKIPRNRTELSQLEQGELVRIRYGYEGRTRDVVFDARNEGIYTFLKRDINGRDIYLVQVKDHAFSFATDVLFILPLATMIGVLTSRDAQYQRADELLQRRGR